VSDEIQTPPGPQASKRLDGAGIASDGKAQVPTITAIGDDSAAAGRDVTIWFTPETVALVTAVTIFSKAFLEPLVNVPDMAW
jgi:hypothetical protein